MPYFGMLDIRRDFAPSSAPKHVKRNTKKSKMARASRRNNRKH